MELTSIQKKLIVLAGTSLLSLVVDQVFFAPGHGSSPDPQASKAATGATPASSVAQVGTGSDVPEMTLGRLQSWGARGVGVRLGAATRPVGGQLEEPHDIFHTGGMQARTSVQEAPNVKAPAVHVDPHAQFLKQYSLTAVMLAGAAGEGGQALVNDRLLRVGQRLGSYRLVSLDTRSALFRNVAMAESDPEATVRLRLSDSTGPNAYSSVK